MKQITLNARQLAGLRWHAAHRPADFTRYGHGNGLNDYFYTAALKWTLFSYKTAGRTGPRNAGTVLVVTLLVLALIALGLASYLALNLGTARLARQGYQQTASFHLAEAGTEEALWSFNRATAGSADAWAGWTVQNASAWKKFTGFDFGGNTTGSVKVYVNNISPGRHGRSPSRWRRRRWSRRARRRTPG